MKKKISAFFLFALVTLLIAPVFNLSTRLDTLANSKTKWWNKSFLYNVDFALPALGKLYSVLGISINPGQVILGKHGWFFLGDDHAQSISIKRNGVTPSTTPLVQQIVANEVAWEAWLKHHGVKQYRVLIGPDKDSIYPEYLPSWAAHAPNQVSREFIHLAPAQLYVDTFTPMLAAKNASAQPLYFKTDTHWNSLGAWVAFQALEQNLNRVEPDLRWPSPELGEVKNVSVRPGGDLSRFQRIQGSTNDTQVALRFASSPQLTVDQYDYQTGKLLSSGPNPELEAPQKPLLVVSKGALNDRKVLWLRDSFGISLSPFMAATFSQSLQIHYDQVDPNQVAELIATFKPDYVIFSAVERVTRMGLFLAPPPQFVISRSRDALTPLAEGQVSHQNDVVATSDADTYQITGIDPYIVFKPSKPLLGSDAKQLTFELTCKNTADTKFPIQIFWSTRNKGFNEADSATFAVSQGVTSVDISSAKGWPADQLIDEVRFDIVTPAGCPTFSLKSLALGQNR